MVIVDTSIWIDYFKGNISPEKLNGLIDSNNVCINQMILSELLPSMIHKKETKLKELIESIRVYPIVINWNEIIHYQIENLKNGINKVGIPDLIIMQNNLELYEDDGHFQKMAPLFGLKIFK